MNMIAICSDAMNQHFFESGQYIVLQVIFAFMNLSFTTSNDFASQLVDVAQRGKIRARLHAYPCLDY